MHLSMLERPPMILNIRELDSSSPASFDWSNRDHSLQQFAMPEVKKAKVTPSLPKEEEWTTTDAAPFCFAVETHVWP